MPAKGMTFQVKIIDDRLTTMRAELRPKAEVIVTKTVFDMEAEAKKNTPPRVDTGAMMNGYTHKQLGPMSYVVFNTQEYHLVHELGGVHTVAHPMLIPAAELVYGPFKDAMRELFR